MKMPLDLDAARFESLRPDANRFVLGVLWLSAIGALTLTPESVLAAVQFVDRTAAELTHVSVPPFVVGFLAVVAGVVLPYCLAAAFTPISLLAANLTLRVHRHFKPSDVEIAKEAHQAVVKDLRLAAPVAHFGRALYLAVCFPELAKDLQSQRRHLEFQAAALLPASILLGWITFQLLPPALPLWVSYLMSASVGGFAFCAGAYLNNSRLTDLLTQVELAAYIAATRGTVVERRQGGVAG